MIICHLQVKISFELCHIKAYVSEEKQQTRCLLSCYLINVIIRKLCPFHDHDVKTLLTYR